MVFMSELTKFGLVPAHAILHSFKVLVDDLTHFNVDSFSMLLEGCGRYVFRNEPTKDKMAALVSFTEISLLSSSKPPRNIVVGNFPSKEGCPKYGCETNQHARVSLLPSQPTRESSRSSAGEDPD